MTLTRLPQHFIIHNAGFRKAASPILESVAPVDLLPSSRALLQGILTFPFAKVA